MVNGALANHSLGSHKLNSVLLVLFWFVFEFENEVGLIIWTTSTVESDEFLKVKNFLEVVQRVKVVEK